MVELRKRPAPAAPAPAPKKRAPSKAKAKATEEEATKEEPAAEEAPAESAAVEKTPKGGAPKVGSNITLEGFGGEIQTNDEEKTTLAKLVADSKAGVVLFTYPKASTPGCTTQVCLFRDSYEPLTATGFSIYGLSTDSPKANTTFKTKQNLPYPLLCDPSATLIAAIGLKKAPKGTTRGVFVVDKSGKVLASEPGGPGATVEVVKKLIESNGAGGEKAETSDEKAAETAAEVADTAEKVDA
ncbi:related to disrupter of telomere silencing protein Dot5 [Ramularia collo-cygni]|uniref:thioredoxin-dependent peroxiredoxin n=1 Tax=Ramularia collo-cygni TaxID=112498 RepID=A0A2D3VJQ3_9PEZI|nr:related to disrupter of telomere silencing protein Dot5 [Ramularia collo-cygni]CZT24651.1 related to disrupter of telomere silencing protein Dot5 [Ramularia collo-cygni]